MLWWTNQVLWWNYLQCFYELAYKHLQKKLILHKTLKKCADIVFFLVFKSDMEHVLYLMF